MKQKSTVLLLAALLALAVPQKNANAQGTETAEQVFERLEERWVAALTKSDTATLDSILSDTYVDTDEHGQRTDKSGMLSVLKSGDLKLESIKLSDMKVYMYGTAVVVTGVAVQVGTFKGQPLANKIAFTDTFFYEDGKWKAVASHRSAM